VKILLLCNSELNLQPSDKESIADLKKKIQHQKDALNKIIKTYSK